MYTKPGSYLILIFLTGFFCSQSVWSQSSVGQALMAKGDVTAKSASKARRKLQRRSPVYEADVVSTGKSSFTVLGFQDKTKLSIRPESELSIKQYRMARGNQNKSKNKVGLELLKGGLRVITGVISKETPRNFSVRGKAGQIGIRGTEFDLRQCEMDCALEQAKLKGQTEPDKNTPPGMYAAVYKGGITGFQHDKELDANPGQAIYFSENSMKLLKEIPLFLSQDQTPMASTVGDESNGVEEDLEDDLEMGVLEGPILQPVPLPGVENQGIPNEPIYEQQPADAQEDFLPEPEPTPVPTIEPVEENQNIPEVAEPEIEEPDEESDEDDDNGVVPSSPPPVIIL